MILFALIAGSGCATRAHARKLVRPVPPCVIVIRDTGSMRPAIVGNPALGGLTFGWLEERDIADVREGDWVEFENMRGDGFTLHAVKAIRHTARGIYLVTQGLDSTQDDGQRVTACELIGVVTISPK